MSQRSHSPKARSANYPFKAAHDWQRLLLSSVVTSSVLLSAAIAWANSPPAGTVIQNQATGSFTNPASGSTENIESNIVSVTVAEVAGITITAIGATEAPSGVTGAGPNQNDGTINTEDVVYFAFLITNVGNDPTQFFIPDKATITGGTISGPMQITAYDTDGTNSITLTTPVNITTNGQTTGAALGLPNGSIAPKGTVTVRVPVKADSALANNAPITVILGDTSAGNRGNQIYSDGTNNLDVYTQDNQDGDTVDVLATTSVVEIEAAGMPINGDATFHRQESSASQNVQVALVTMPSGSRPFTCDASLYVVIGSESNPFSQLSRINRSAAPFAFDPIGPQVNNYNYNALAYNPVDNYLYGIVEFAGSGSPFPAGTVLKIGTDGVPVSLGIPQGDAITYRPNAGTFLANGTYVVGRQTNPIVTLDVTTSPPTATNRGTVAGGALFDDIAVNPYDTTPNRVYGVEDISDRLVYFDLTNTGAGVTAVGGTTGFNHNYGSQFYDVFGNFLYRSGGVNELYVVAANGSSTKLSNTPSGGSHDGASCFAVGLSKEANNTQPVSAGQNVTYTYRMANASSLTMSVTLIDDLRSVNDYAGTPGENESSTPINGTYTGTVTTSSGTVVLSNSNQTISISNITLPPRSITPVMVEVTVPPSATPDTYYNQATLTGLPPNFVLSVKSDYPTTVLYEDPTPLAVTNPISSVPQVLLAKRITAINRGRTDEQLFNRLGSESYVNVGTNIDDDNAVNWPGASVSANTGSSAGSPVESYIAGIAGISDLTAVENTTIQPGDELEYTIPFLSNGNMTAQDLLICDRIPPNTTFLSTAFNNSALAAPGSGDHGIFISFNGLNVALTNVNDSDEIANTGGNDNGIGGYYFAPGVDPSSAFPGKTVGCGGSNTNGAIVVDLSDVPNATGGGVPNNSYGFIRFRAVVN